MKSPRVAARETRTGTWRWNGAGSGGASPAECKGVPPDATRPQQAIKARESGGDVPAARPPATAGRQAARQTAERPEAVGPPPLPEAGACPRTGSLSASPDHREGPDKRVSHREYGVSTPFTCRW